MKFRLKHWNLAHFILISYAMWQHSMHAYIYFTGRELPHMNDFESFYVQKLHKSKLWTFSLSVCNSAMLFFISRSPSLSPFLYTLQSLNWTTCNLNHPFWDNIQLQANHCWVCKLLFRNVFRIAHVRSKGRFVEQILTTFYILYRWNWVNKKKEENNRT